LKIDKHVAVVMAMDMIFAGVDTTSTAVINCLYHMGLNPDKQSKLRDEIKKILPNVDSKLTSDSLHSMPYLRACMKEAFRLTPLTNGNFRSAGRDLVIRGYRIPKGTDVATVNMLVQVEEEHFAQSKKFIPERWLKNKQGTVDECPMTKATNPFIYMPFGFGARSCIGKRFAEMEMEVMLARLIREFTIEWHYEPIKYTNSLVLSPEGDLKFRLIENKD